MKYFLSSYIYLGAPLWFGCKKIADFQYLSAKIHSRIVNWESHLLSWVGKTCLIKLVSDVMAKFVTR